MDGDPRTVAPDALSAVLDWLMPMHLVLDADARVLGHGRTAGRLFVGRSVLGESFIDMFDLRSPRSLTDSAHETGFADLSHMSRAFGMACGMSPSLLRRAAQGGLIPEVG